MLITYAKSRPEGMTRAYFKDAVGAALVYDAHSQKSFDNIQKIWIPQLTAFGHSAMPMILVANKLDDGDQSDRIVSSEAGIQLAREHSCSYVEVSAKTNFNVDVMFRRLIFSVAIVIPSIQAAINADELPPGWISVGSDRSSGDVYSNYWTGETAAIKPTGPAPVSVGGSLDAYINTDINLRDSFW